MLFNKVLCLLVPAIIALYFYEKIINKKKTIKDLVCMYFIFNFLINVFCYSVIVFIFKRAYFLYSEQFTIKYMLLSLIIIPIITIVIIVLENNFKISVETVKK